MCSRKHNSDKCLDNLLAISLFNPCINSCSKIILPHDRKCWLLVKKIILHIKSLITTKLHNWYWWLKKMTYALNQRIIDYWIKFSVRNYCTVKLVKTESQNKEILLITNKLHWPQQRADDNIYISSPVNKNVHPLITEANFEHYVSNLLNTLVMVLVIGWFLKDCTQSN